MVAASEPSGSWLALPATQDLPGYLPLLVLSLVSWSSMYVVLERLHRLLWPGSTPKATVSQCSYAVSTVHGEIFGEIRPASTMVVVASLIDPRWKVEVELDAVVAE